VLFADLVGFTTASEGRDAEETRDLLSRYFDLARTLIERYRFRGATALFREFGIAFYQAVTQLEHGEWLIGQGRSDEADPLLAEAAEAFERIQATPWLERVEALGAARGEEVPA